MLVRIANALGTTPNELLGVTEADKPTKHSQLLDRLATAAGALAEAELEILAIQAEALAARHLRKPNRTAQKR
jgi:hypothetical protein